MTRTRNDEDLRSFPRLEVVSWLACNYTVYLSPDNYNISDLRTTSILQRYKTNYTGMGHLNICYTTTYHSCLTLHLILLLEGFKDYLYTQMI